MKLIRIAAAALNQTPLAWEENRKNILTAIDEAREERATILSLPELCITGYGSEDAFLSAGVCKTAIDLLEEIVPHTKGVAVVGVYPFEVAETKVTQVMDCARSNQHPLQCTMEKE